jgi:hypothetical protein
VRLHNRKFGAIKVDTEGNYARLGKACNEIKCCVRLLRPINALKTLSVKRINDF